LQIPPQIDEHGELRPPPDRFEAELDGYKYIVTRVKEEEADDSDVERGVDREDQYEQHEQHEQQGQQKQGQQKQGQQKQGQQKQGQQKQSQQKQDQPKESSAEAHQGLQSPTLMPDSMGDNFHGDHPPLDDSISVATAETHAEKRELRQRERAAVRDYYNTYRNPLSRLRARYPEAFAEFLAVRPTLPTWLRRS
jgi:aquaglyceroporin related protein